MALTSVEKLYMFLSGTLYKVQKTTNIVKNIAPITAIIKVLLFSFKSLTRMVITVNKKKLTNTINKSCLKFNTADKNNQAENINPANKHIFKDLYLLNVVSFFISKTPFYRSQNEK